MRQEDLLKLVRREFKDGPFVAKDQDQNWGFSQVRNYVDHTRNAFEFGNLNSKEFRERFKGDYVLETWKNYYSPSFHRMKEIQEKELSYAIDKDMVNANSGRHDSHAESFEDKVRAKHKFETAYFHYHDNEILGKPNTKDETQLLEDTYLNYRRHQGMTYKKDKVEAEIKTDNWIEESKKKIELDKTIKEGTLQRKVELIAMRGEDPNFKPNRETPELAALAEESGLFMRKDFIQKKVAEITSEKSLKEKETFTSNIKKSVDELSKTNPNVSEQVKEAQKNLVQVANEVKEQSSWDDNMAWAKNYKPIDQVKQTHSMPITNKEAQTQAIEVPSMPEVKSNVIDLRSRSEVKVDTSDWDAMEQWAKNRPKMESKTPMLSLVEIKPLNPSTTERPAPKPLYEIPGTIQKWEDQTPEFKKVIFEQEERMRARGENVQSVIPKEHLDVMLKEKESLKQKQVDKPVVQKEHKQHEVFTQNIQQAKQKMHGMRMKMKAS